jgi:hypothetical protein
MRSRVEKPDVVVALLRRELEEEVDNYELMRCGSESLLAECNTLCDQIADLESELVEVKMGATRDISIMEAKVASTEARAVDDAAAAEKCLVDFRAKLTKGIVGLHKAYERNIQRLGGICTPSSNATPSVQDYVCWLTSEVGYLPGVFTSVNENFISTAIEGVLKMPDETGSIDPDALQTSAAESGADVLPGSRDG